MRTSLALMGTIGLALTMTTGSAWAAETDRACARPSVRTPAPLFASTSAPVDSPFAAAFTGVTFAAPASCVPPPVRHLAPRAEPVGLSPDQGPPARAFIYSDAYLTRAALHKKASYAMLPLVITEAVLGQKMFNNPQAISTGKQTAHRVVGMGIGGLFAVNTVTGVMNLWESRKDPQGLMLRTVHATLMMVADFGFLASAATRPNSHTAEGLTIYDAKKNQHMTIAYASISVATVGYLIMLFH